MKSSLPTEQLAAAILAADLPASAALGRPDVYDALNRGAAGPLPFLGTSAKIDAGMNVGVLSAVLYMMPANASGRQACPHATECEAVCLAEYTGRMSMSGPRRARIRRHASFLADRGRFLADLHAEIAAHERAAIRAGKIPAIRLNGTTDLPWHRMKFTAHDGTEYARIHDAFPAVRFYEYTKNPMRVSAKGGIPANLWLTYSMNERAGTDALAAEYLNAGYSAAVVTFTKRHDVPSKFPVNGQDRPTIDGDAHDARFLDAPGSVVILSAKGRAKSDTSGFVRTVPTV
jgi:hypothetical protein